MGLMGRHHSFVVWGETRGRGDRSKIRHAFGGKGRAGARALEVGGTKITKCGAERDVYRRGRRGGLTVGERRMDVSCQNAQPGDRPAAAINHAVERILMIMDRRGDKCPFHCCKDERE